MTKSTGARRNSSRNVAADVCTEAQATLPILVRRRHDPRVRPVPAATTNGPLAIRVSLAGPPTRPHPGRASAAPVSDRNHGGSPPADSGSPQDVACPCRDGRSGSDGRRGCPPRGGPCRRHRPPRREGATVSASRSEPAASCVSSTTASSRPVPSAMARATRSTIARRLSGSRMRDAPGLMTSCGAVGSASDGAAWAADRTPA